ncbi:hypothetical protein B0H13DRAFT_2374626 [Mycena leptocephala]|nr:hypothetical protein B0H13DRAFT_2374626 [Mycena leptocephala]
MSVVQPSQTRLRGVQPESSADVLQQGGQHFGTCILDANAAAQCGGPAANAPSAARRDALGPGRVNMAVTVLGVVVLMYMSTLRFPKMGPDLTPHVYETPDRDELAGAKLWAVYISEAEKYDKALVEGWKSDMEGLLIFAGLFSASLTAFLVESYKTLTRRRLQRFRRGYIAVNGVPPRPPPLLQHLWFLSLGFSLSCALIATLVEQWSRDFIQSTEMRPSPVIRARIFAYLYFGLQKFGMHSLVQFIPLLLHISLLLFFAGLVAFLHPINPALTAVAAALLGPL